MINKKSVFGNTVNQSRRKLIQGAATMAAAGIAPAAFGCSYFNTPESKVTGELVCKLSNPVKTLVLRNHSGKTIEIDQLSNSAFMFDGSVVDCNAACIDKSIAIEANQEVHIQFDKRRQFSFVQKVNEYQRVQSRVSRLSDGTRVIPFAATLSGKTASLA